MNGKLTEKKIGLILVLMGVIGVVFFFPLKLEKGRTCLAQCYVQGETVQADRCAMMAHGHALATDYVFPYGLMWWLSISISVIGFYFIRKKRERSEDLNMVQDNERGETVGISE